MNDAEPAGPARHRGVRVDNPGSDDERPGVAAPGYENTPAERLDALVTLATRAPSVHNTQPWRFRAGERGLELYADPGRQLTHLDPNGREMLISCGAALFGLRLGVRSLGRRPAVELLPAHAPRDLLARVHIGGPSPVGPGVRRLLAANSRRHTHRGPFADEPLPAGLLAGLQRDAEAEGATLVIVDRPGVYGRLAALVAAADRRQRYLPALSAELRTWTHSRTSHASDGVPARAYPRRVTEHAGRLAQRDFDLGRGWGVLDTDGHPPPASVILTTVEDTPMYWLRAGQALHRVLLHAAGEWVFASLHTQPLEIATLRAALGVQLGLRGVPQMVLQLGRSHIAPLTGRRPVPEVLVGC